MTQIVNVPSCEQNLGHSVADFMFVESNQPEPLSKRLYQSKMNSVFKVTEQELDIDIANFFKEKTDLVLKSSKIYHSSHLLASCLNVAKFKNYANGLSFLYLEFENHSPLFFYTVCSKQDNFSRLEGRVYAKRKALYALNSKGIDGLYSYPTLPEYASSINPFKVGNWIVKHKILPEREKAPIYVNPLKYENEDRLLAMAKELISQKYDINLDTIRLHTQHIRFYETALFSHGLVCTPEWFNNLQQEGKKLISTGGYTMYAMVGTKKDSDEKEVFVAASRCSNEEAFVKAYGRKQCLINFIKDQVEVYKLSQPVESMNSALISLAEQAFKHAINVEIVSTNESSLVKS